MPKINFTGVTDGFPVVPEGEYECRLESWKWHETGKNSEYGNLELVFVATDEADEYEGRKFWRRQSEDPSALWAMKRALVRLGADPDEIEGEFDLEDVMPDLIGNTVILVVDQYEYPENSGEMRNNVKDILASNAVRV